MTREESIGIIKTHISKPLEFNIHYTDCNKLINTIYDDFESRICENCKHIAEKEDGFVCLNMLSIGWWCDEGVTLTDTCKRFERKEDD